VGTNPSQLHERLWRSGGKCEEYQGVSKCLSCSTLILDEVEGKQLFRFHGIATLEFLGILLHEHF